MANKVSLTTKHLISFAVLITLGFFSLITFTAPTQAARSELRQNIQLPDCSQPGSCNMAPPSIELISKNMGQPLFSGSYDAVFTRYLRIIFGERVYEPNIDQELSVQNARWQLDLSQLVPALGPGSYELIIEAEGFDGGIKRDSIVVTFSAHETDTEQGASVDGPDRPVPRAPDTGLARKGGLTTLIALIGLVGLLAGWLAVLRHRERHRR